MNAEESTCGLSPYLQTFHEPRNRFLGIDSASLHSLAGQYVKKGYRTSTPGWEAFPLGCLKGLQRRALVFKGTNRYGGLESSKIV